MFPTETDVLIVGAGPTGLSLAITLQQAGIRHLLIDKLSEGQGHHPPRLWFMRTPSRRSNPWASRTS